MELNRAQKSSLISCHCSLVDDILRAEERSSGLAPPEPTVLEILVEEILSLEETADAEMKVDNERVREKAEKRRLRPQIPDLQHLRKC